jgi:hypothetical protein
MASSRVLKPSIAVLASAVIRAVVRAERSALASELRHSKAMKMAHATPKVSAVVSTTRRCS